MGEGELRKRLSVGEKIEVGFQLGERMREEESFGSRMKE